MVEDAFKMSAQKLAFLGDAVYELLVREKIVNECSGSIGELNNIKLVKLGARRSPRC